jgi:adenylate cyclase
MAGRNQEALPVFNTLLERSLRGEWPELYTQVNLTAVKMALGQEQEARQHAAEVLRLNPKFSLEWWIKMELFKDRALLERRLEPMCKAGLPEKPPLPLPDKPSIAVLPFANMSDDKSQEYFSDGLTEEIITALSKSPNLVVIARNSSFVYKGKPVNVQQVSRELGVKYVLEGSVRRSGDQLRITAQLIDATTGNHLWAERYDRKLKDIFAIQDEVTMKILTSLQVKLTDGEVIQMAARGTKNLDAYLKYLQAADLINQFNKESNIRAREPAEEAIRLDPHFPAAYSTLGSINMMDVWLQISKSPKDSLMKAIELHQKALSLDDSFATSHAFLGFLYVQIREHEKGIVEAERAVEMAPNFASGYSFLAQVLTYSGRPEEAIAHNERAFRLNPLGPPIYYYSHAAHTYTLTSRYEDGVKICLDGVSRYPNSTLLHARLAMLYAALDRKEEARASVQDVLRLDPKFSAQRYAKSMPYKDPVVTGQSLELMRNAGLPD